MLSRGAPQPPLQRVVVESSRVVKPEMKGRPGSEIWGIKLREVPSRDAAEALAQQKLLLALCDREKLRKGDEYFIQDLVGLKVRGNLGGGAGEGDAQACMNRGAARTRVNASE
jgi:ribosomal 30S subunit maturation factor RimM